MLGGVVGGVLVAGLLGAAPASAAPVVVAYQQVPARGAGPYVAYVGDAYSLRVRTVDGSALASCRVDYGDGDQRDAVVRGDTCLQGKTWDAAGQRTVTTTVTDADGDTGSVSATVQVRERPVAGTVTPDEGSPADLSVDPPGPVRWRIEDAAGDDPSSAGPPCWFSDTGGADTTVTCNRPGDYVAIADDAGTWSQAVDVDVQNVAPRPTMVLSDQVTDPEPTDPDHRVLLVGEAYTAVVTTHDPGYDPTGGCLVDWGDGQRLDLRAYGLGPQCTARHAWLTPGRRTVDVTAVDGEGARGSTSRLVTVKWRRLDADVTGRLDGARVTTGVRLRRSAPPVGSFVLDPRRGQRLVGGAPYLVQTYPLRAIAGTGMPDAVRRAVRWQGSIDRPARPALDYAVLLYLDGRDRVLQTQVTVFGPTSTRFDARRTSGRAAVAHVGR